MHDTSISVLLSKVSIIDTVSCHSASNTCCICTVFFDCLVQSDEITFAFAHFFAFNVDITVTIVASWPELLIIPNGCMIE